MSDHPSASVLDPMAFVSALVGVSLKAAASSRAQYAALAAAAGRSSEGPVDVVVAPGGAVRSIEFSEEPSGHAPTALAAAVRTAYARAAAEANRATAAAADPRLRQLVGESLPPGLPVAAEMAPAISDHPAAPVAQRPTVADLPSDPELDRLLAILDDDDPVRAVQRLRADPATPHIDLDRPAEEIDAEIRGQLEAFASKVNDLAPALRAVRGTVTSDVGTVTVDGWGGLIDIQLAAGVRTRKAADLGSALTGLFVQASAIAGQAAADLIKGEGLASADDPVLVGLDPTSGGRHV